MSDPRYALEVTPARIKPGQGKTLHFRGTGTQWLTETPRFSPTGAIGRIVPGPINVNSDVSATMVGVVYPASSEILDPPIVIDVAAQLAQVSVEYPPSPELTVLWDDSTTGAIAEQVIDQAAEPVSDVPPTAKKTAVAAMHRRR